MINKVIENSYDNLHIKEKLMEYCEKNDIDLRTIHHSRIKNYVMNSLYCADELSENEKFLFTFIYDLKAQQRYLPWIHISQEKLAFILWKSKGTISKDINSLISKNLIIKAKNRFNETVLIPNENINTWWVSIDMERLSFLEEKRKHTASSHKQLESEYKSHTHTKE